MVVVVVVVAVVVVVVVTRPPFPCTSIFNWHMTALNLELHG